MIFSNSSDITFHPSYQNGKRKRKTVRLIYGGSAMMKTSRSIQEYLYQHKNETNEDYEVRKKRAILDPWAEKIITQRQSILWGKSPVRQLPQMIEEYELDVDSKGTSANKFFYDITEKAQIDGIAFVLINYPKVDWSEIKTKRDEIEHNIRPYFEYIDPDSVLDWSFTPEGQLAWILIQEVKAQTNRSPGEAYSNRTYYTLWTRDQWIVYEEDTDSDALIIKDKESHGLNNIPVVAFYGNKEKEMQGSSVLYKILDHILLLFNKESDKDHFEKLSCHPIPYAISSKKPERFDSGKGFWLSNEEGSGTSVGYMEPSGNSFQTVMESIKDIRYRILNIALSMNKKETSQVESSETQRESRRAFSISLSNLSDHYQQAEKKCWEFMLEWFIGPAADVEVEYTKDFDDSIMDEGMIKALSDLVFKDQLPLKIFWDILKAGEILPSSFDVDSALSLLSSQNELLNLDGNILEHNAQKG